MRIFSLSRFGIEWQSQGGKGEVKVVIPGGYRTRQFCRPLFHPDDEHEFYAGSEMTQQIDIESSAIPGPAF